MHAEELLTIRPFDDAQLVSFNIRELRDEQLVNEVDQCLTTRAEDQPSMRLILDYTGVDGISSAMLGLMIKLRRMLREAGGAVHLTGVSQHIASALQCTHLDQVFPSFDSPDAAARAFSY